MSFRALEYTYEIDRSNNDCDGRNDDAFISKDGVEIFTLSRATWRGPDSSLYELHRHGNECPTAIVRASSIGQATRHVRRLLEDGTPLPALECAA